MNIALIAHDKKKLDLIQFVTAYKEIFKQHNLYATGTTGLGLMKQQVFRFIVFSQDR